MSGFSFGVTVRVELLHANEMRFPAVTVCNMSPVRKSAAVRMAQQKQAAAEQVQARKKKRKRKKRASKSCHKLLSYGFSSSFYVRGSLALILIIDVSLLVLRFFWYCYLHYCKNTDSFMLS